MTAMVDVVDDSAAAAERPLGRPPRSGWQDAGMPDTRALVFDVFGTLVDWRGSLLHEAAGLRSAPDAVDWPSLIDDWRRAYQPALDRVGSGGTWRDLDEVHRGTLGDVLGRHDIALSVDDRDTLVGAWRRLRPWPDTRAGLERLRSGYRTATLSNGHVALLVDLFRFGDLRVDTLLSAQLADTYKPMPRAYLRGAELLGCEPGQVAMVAAHSADLVAAARVGMRPMFVRRPAEWGPGGEPTPPTGLPGLVVADDLEQLADLLGC
jgi:2-haloacid dehalogenase